MPPHPDMALVQALLVRALLARFAEEPYSGPADPLGHRAARAVPAAALRWPTWPTSSPTCAAHGIDIDLAWFDRTWSSGSRGSASPRSAASTWSCARAIEPWNVLGEESGSGGTARYVDSSTERLQVAVTGFDPEPARC